MACKVVQNVWNGLGVPERFGFSKVGGHKHCRLPESQVPEVVAFVEKYLLGNQSADTDIARRPYNPDLSRGITQVWWIRQQFIFENGEEAFSSMTPYVTTSAVNVSKKESVSLSSEYLAFEYVMPGQSIVTFVAD